MHKNCAFKNVEDYTKILFHGKQFSIQNEYEPLNVTNSKLKAVWKLVLEKLKHIFIDPHAPSNDCDCITRKEIFLP